MRMLSNTAILLAAAAGAAFAQQWELGGSAGGSFLNSLPVTSAAASATAGFKSGAAFGGFIGQNLYRNVSGEIRYGYIMSDLRAQSGGETVTFTGVAHVLHYDVILHTSRRNSRTQLFAALGGGMKIFRGTGREAAYQPLSQYVYLTKTQAVKPMASVGGGVKYALTPKVFLRVEVRDYITPFPTQLITPATGAKINGSILHDIVPMAGLSFLL